MRRTRNQSGLRGTGPAPAPRTIPLLYPVSRPDLGSNERRHLLAAYDETGISSVGRHVAAFEKAFATWLDVPHALAVSCGTAALHLALVALGVGPGDEVIVPDLTFIAPANTVRYTGAQPVLVDVDPRSWTIDPAAVERAISKRTRAVIAVHLYGVPADLDALRAIARRHRLALLEDAAEALGSSWRGKRLGALGTVGCFSLFANKTITTGEGGVVVTRSAARARRLRLLRDHGMSPSRRYYHPVIGFNYRMTALQAAVGLGQVERIEELVGRRQRVARWYREELADVQGLSEPEPVGAGENAPWLHTIAVEGLPAGGRNALIRELASRGVDSRPTFVPLSAMPPYRTARRIGRTPHAHRIAASALSLPTYTALRRSDVAAIGRALRAALVAVRGS